MHVEILWIKKLSQWLHTSEPPCDKINNITILKNFQIKISRNYTNRKMYGKSVRTEVCIGKSYNKLERKTTKHYYTNSKYHPIIFLSQKFLIYQSSISSDHLRHSSFWIPYSVAHIFNLKCTSSTYFSYLQ